MAQYSLYRPWGSGARGVPIDQLQREMDALFNRYGGAPTNAATWSGGFPAVNLYETKDAYMLTAELPGLSNEDIQVSLEGSTVTLQGERKVDYAGQKDASLHRAERQSGSFRRAFALPAEVDADKVEAVHKNGVLVLRLPKKPEHQPRQISVLAS